MDNTERTVLALALTESGGVREAWGDGGRAMGAWQTHPAWLFEQAERFCLSPSVGATWHEFQRVVVEAWVFHEVAVLEVPPWVAAMKFHLGHRVEFDSPEWDTEYARKFFHFYTSDEATLKAAA